MEQGRSGFLALWLIDGVIELHFKLKGLGLKGPQVWKWVWVLGR